jgi:hypothetical protein
VQVLGVDFTSAPRRAKPIVVASGLLAGASLHVDSLERLESFAAFERFLARPGPWVGGFDFAFGLPRVLVVAMGWPLEWAPLLRHLRSLPRDEIAARLDAFRAARRPGDRYAHRRGDAVSGAHPSMKLVNPPVGWMFLAGAPRLLDAGVHVPGLHPGDCSRVALEAYPGLLVRRLAQRAGRASTPSYKNDARSKQTPARREARAWLVELLHKDAGALGLAISLTDPIALEAIDEASGDVLDAIAAAAQAAWGALRADSNYGLPAGLDPIEGWIVTA